MVMSIVELLQGPEEIQTTVATNPCYPATKEI